MDKNFETVEVTSRAQWRGWLEANHHQSQSIWLVTYKAHTGERHVPYSDVVEEALCFGWVDSLPRKFDVDRSMLLLSPRKPRSAWSRANRERVERLTAQGLMHPAGLAVVAAAKASGRWTFLNSVEDLSVPADLSAAFDSHPGAREAFSDFPPSVRRGILEWIAQARTDPTRQKRVDETARLAAQGIRANQFRQPHKGHTD